MTTVPAAALVRLGAMHPKQWCHKFISPMIYRGMGPTGIAFVSYWEWAKLIATSVVISISITAIAFALWWWLLV